MSRVVKQETVRLALTQGDWIEIKKRLNAGEHQDMFARMVKPVHASGNGTGATPITLEVDPIQATISTAVAYLVDWSIVDDDGKLLVIKRQPPDVVAAKLRALDMESYTEITQAIQAHEAAVSAERQAPFGESASSPISASVA